MYGTLTESDIGVVLAQYGMGTHSYYSPIERGYVNDKWLLETEKGQYVLKRRHAGLRQPSLLLAQHALVQHLRSVGFPAPALVLTCHHSTFLEHAGEVYEMQVFVPGDPFDGARPCQLSASARMLGFYHNAVQKFDYQAFHRAEERYGYDALARILKELLKCWPCSMPSELEVLISHLKEHVQDLRNRYLTLPKLPELVIHGDYHGANLIYQGNQIVGVVDYDLAHWSSRAMEVAEAIIAFCTDPGLGLKHIVYTGVLNMEQVMSFLSAYQEVVPLAWSEIQALPDLIRTIWLCAALDPPLGSLLSCEAAPSALPEILKLADWAVANESTLAKACLLAQKSRREAAGA